MKNTPNQNRSFFSMAAWYAVFAAVAAAASSGVIWIALFNDVFGATWENVINVAFVATLFFLITSILASVVSLFGIRRHGWRVIVWKSLAGCGLSFMVVATPLAYFMVHPIIRVVETENRTAITNRKAMMVDLQNLVLKGEEMVDSLIGSAVLDKAAEHPVAIAIGRIVNNTPLNIDTELLIKKIQSRLNASGKVLTDTSGGTLKNGNFTFSGKIVQPLNVREGNTARPTYKFQLSLTDSRGLAVWEEEKEVSILTKVPSVALR